MITRLILLCCGLLGLNLVLAEEQPNFLIFLADDCSYHDFGCYGNAQVLTPRVDKLAGEGMRFVYAFNSAPMCAPTRMSLYTGLHPVRNGGHPNHSRVYDHVQSFPHYLHPLGYKVALIGKTHHAPKENFPFEFLGGRHHDGGKGEDLELEKVRQFLEDNRAQPWCLMVNSNQPHAPWNRGDPAAYDPEKLTLPPYFVDTPVTRRELTNYYAEITYMDTQLGECLNHLEATGQAENTVVIFLSEQGSNFPHCKWTCYDTGLRSAQIVRWPGKVAAGSTTEALVQYVDILPTCLELAGGAPNSLDLDGRSFVPVLKGESKTHHAYVFGVQTSRGIHAGPEAYGIRTVRDQRYRLIWNLNYENQFQNTVTNGFKPFQSWKARASQGDAFAQEQVSRYETRPEFELYDLKADPYELSNLADDPSQTERIGHLKAELERWMDQQGDDGVATEMNALERMSNPKAP